MSVSRPVALRRLFDEWQELYDRGKITRDDSLLKPWLEAKMFFTQDEFDPTAQPWSWHEEFCLFPDKARLLARRPLKETHLTHQDIQAAISQGEGILRALRTQQVTIEESNFFYYSNDITSLVPYTLAMLIELSRRSNFDQNIWIERFLEIIPIPDYKRPLSLTPSIYCLLNPSWCVP